MSEPVFIRADVSPGPVTSELFDWPAGCGAESVFLGRTRVETHREFGRLIRLEYEVYEPMALKLMQAMATDAAAKWGCQAVRISHAQGVVMPGQASVVIQVATPHRSEAFTACRYLIDRIKHELPVWKREIWEKGVTFVEGCCATPAADTEARTTSHDHSHAHPHSHPHTEQR